MSFFQAYEDYNVCFWAGSRKIPESGLFSFSLPSDHQQMTSWDRLYDKSQVLITQEMMSASQPEWHPDENPVGFEWWLGAAPWTGGYKLTPAGDRGYRP